MDNTTMVLFALAADVHDMRMRIRAKMEDIELQGAVDTKMYGLYAVEYITLTNVLELIESYRRDDNDQL